MAENDQGPVPERGPSAEELREVRETVILWADERRRDARRLEGRALGIAHERYIIGQGLEVPFFSERVRITPLRPSDQNLRDLYLYFPYDGFQGGQAENTTPPLIFVRVVTPEDVSLRYVISKRKTSVFLSKDEMHVAMEHFDTRLAEVGLDGVIEENQVLPGTENEYNILKELLTYLTDKNTYRIAAQPQADVA